MQDLFEPTITQPELIGIFDRLRAPRHLFKFLYRLLVDHCSKYTEDEPQWKIQPETLLATLAVFHAGLAGLRREARGGMMRCAVVRANCRCGHHRS